MGVLGLREKREETVGDLGCSRVYCVRRSSCSAGFAWECRFGGSATNRMVGGPRTLSAHQGLSGMRPWAWVQVGASLLTLWGARCTELSHGTAVGLAEVHEPLHWLSTMYQLGHVARAHGR